MQTLELSPDDVYDLLDDPDKTPWGVEFTDGTNLRFHLGDGDKRVVTTEELYEIVDEPDDATLAGVEWKDDGGLIFHYKEDSE